MLKIPNTLTLYRIISLNKISQITLKMKGQRGKEVDIFHTFNNKDNNKKNPQIPKDYDHHIVFCQIPGKTYSGELPPPLCECILKVSK